MADGSAMLRASARAAAQRPPADGEEPLTRIIQRAQRIAGIQLDGKRSMVAARLGRRLRQLNLGLAAYADRLANDPAEEGVLLDLVATSHTSWWREPVHFADLQQRVLAPLARQQVPRMRIWCAGASTGEEAYSLALCVHKHVRGCPRHEAAILATDLSRRALAQARAGRYDARAAMCLPAADRRLALREEGASPNGVQVVTDELRRLVHFAQLNLMDPWPMRGPFDAIFCRNVLLYFTPATQSALITRFTALLAPAGALYVGLSESLTAIDHGLVRVAPSVYARP